MQNQYLHLFAAYTGKELPLFPGSSLQKFFGQFFHFFLAFSAAFSGLGRFFYFLKGRCTLFHRICNVTLCDLIAGADHLFPVHLYSTRDGAV